MRDESQLYAKNNDNITEAFTSMAASCNSAMKESPSDEKLSPRILLEMNQYSKKVKRKPFGC